MLGRDPRCYSESGPKLEIPVKKSGTGAESDRFENDEKARDETRSRAGAFRALRHRNYRLYFIGQLTSLAGTWMQSAAQAWLVLGLTNSSLMLGVVSFAQFFPILLVGLFAGVAVDRIDCRRMLLGTQTLLMLSAFTLAGLTWSGSVRLPR